MSTLTAAAAVTDDLRLGALVASLTEWTRSAEWTRSMECLAAASEDPRACQENDKWRGPRPTQRRPRKRPKRLSQS